MSPAIAILAVWAVVCVVLIALLFASGRGDRRTSAQFDALHLGHNPGRRREDRAALLRSTVALERGRIEVYGYGALLLARLTVQACRVAGVESAGIFVHDAARDELALIAAHRLDPEIIGKRAPATGRVRDVVLMGGRSLIPAVELWPIQHLLPPRGDALVAGIAGGSARGVLVAAGGGPFSERDLALVGHVADLAGAALGDAELRSGLDAALEGGVRALEAAIERADLRGAATSQDVVRLATALGRLLGLDAPALVELQLAARLRGAGELGPEREGAWEGHGPHDGAARAAAVLGRVPGLEVVALIVRHEPERWDGRGGPEQLAAERIPLASRILAVASAFSELTGADGSSDHDAVTLMTVAAGTRFDPVVVETLAALALPAPGAAGARPAAHPEWAADDRELVPTRAA
ncbi:MAG: hypothetical protein QOJ07_210 [Thermoleophilaceae bacterium]|nr:hypothetical protein [Thermoleophilaceae bacterium]